MLQKLRDHNLFAKLSKCTFGVDEVEYLGFILKGRKLEMNLSKTQAIDPWVVLKNKTEVHPVLRLTNYYRRFIRDFARISKPLTDLIKDAPFVWTDESNNAFETLKKAVTSAPILNQFDPKKTILIATDACKFAIGAVVEQEFKDCFHPVFLRLVY